MFHGVAATLALVSRRFGRSEWYSFEVLWPACHPATWSARFGPAEQGRRALWPHACEQEPQAPRGLTPAWLGAGSDLPWPAGAESARPGAAPDGLSVGPARRSANAPQPTKAREHRARLSTPGCS